jgi:hypothetical protein
MRIAEKAEYDETVAKSRARSAWRSAGVWKKIGRSSCAVLAAVAGA